MNGPTRVTLVEDHTLLAQSMVIVLSSHGLNVTTAPLPGVYTEARDLASTILSTRPDVVVLDLDLGAAGDGVPLIAHLRAAGCAVLVVTAATDPARWGECLERGAAAVLPKSAQIEEILHALCSVAAGNPVIDDAQRDRLVGHARRDRATRASRHSTLNTLTRRESEVLAALSHGHRVRDIAAEFFVSEATVRTQVKSILAKLGVTSQLAAVAIARDAGWAGAG